MSFIQQFFTSRDNNANAETFVGQEGRLWWDPVTNQIYSSDGSTPGGIPLSGGGGGNGTPGGSNSQVQFNDNGTFGGTANLTINSATGQLSTVSVSASGNVTGGNLLTGGTVEFAGGSRLRPVGANLDIVAGAGSYVNLITSDESSYMGVDNAGGYIVTAGGTWNFDTSGALTLPGATAGENIATQSGYITVGNLLIGQGGSLFNSNNDSWALYGNLSDPGTTIFIPSNADAGNGLALYFENQISNVEIRSGGTWAFNTDGTTTFPGNIINSNANPITLWSTNSSGLLWRDSAGGAPGQPVQTTITAGNGTATITVSTGVLAVQSQKTWTFNTAGNAIFPDASVQTTAYPGNATSLTLSGNITGSNVIGTTGVSVGGTGGDLTMTGGAITGVGNITANGIVAINAPGGITTTAGSFDIVNATATTVNIGGSAAAVNIGATTGTVTINNPTIVGSQTSLTLFNTTASNVSAFGAASNLIMGATSGTMTLRNPTIVGTQTTQSLFNTVATTVNFAGAATALNIGGAGNATFSANTLVRIANTSGLALSVAGNITGGNILGGANVNATLFTGTTVSMSGNVTGGNVIATTTVYGNAATAFVAGTAAISGVALQMPQEGALRNLNNGSTNMYFDVSTGGSTNGQFQFRSSNAFTNVLTMSPTAFSVNTEAVVTAKTASFGRLPWNSAIDTELTVDNYRFRVSNQGGIFPQIISNTGGTVNSAWTVVAARSGSAISQAGSTGALVPNNTWTSLYTFGGMDSAGDTFIATLQDKTAGRIYRVTFMRSDNGATTGYNIIAERLI